MEQNVIVYHADCADGKTAAAVLAVALNSKNTLPCKIMPFNYGWVLSSAYMELFKDAHLYVVDFCFTPDQMDAVIPLTLSMTVLDHHATAANRFDGYGQYRRFVSGSTKYADITFVENSSGAGLAYEYAFLDRIDEYPVSADVRARCEYLADRAEDYDLWKFKLKDTMAVHWLLMDKSVEGIIDLLTGGDDAYFGAIEYYRIVATLKANETTALAKKAKLVDIGYKDYSREFTHVADVYTPAQCIVNLVNAPAHYGSLVCDWLNNTTSHSVSISWTASPDKVYVSVRSNTAKYPGVSAREIAESYGGGGHNDAAGFSLKPWQLPLLLSGKLKPASKWHQALALLFTLWA